MDVPASGVGGGGGSALGWGLTLRFCAFLCVSASVCGDCAPGAGGDHGRALSALLGAQDRTVRCGFGQVWVRKWFGLARVGGCLGLFNFDLFSLL